MNITLVTGATGLVGYSIVQELLHQKRNVRVLVRSLEKGKRLLPPECELVQGDITDKLTIKSAMQGCDIVYHAAGFPEQWMRDPNTFQQVNVEGTQNMVDVALELGIKRFIYTSTIDVFEAKAGESYDESTLDSHPKGTYYERSKQQADQRVTAALKQGLPAVFLHPSGVYGPGPTDSPGTNDLIMKLYKNDAPALIPGGYPVVFSTDVGKGHVLAELKGGIGERYILSESYYSLTELATLMLDALNIDKKPPAVLPLPLVHIVATAGEWIAKLINKAPLIPKGQVIFLQWQAHPQSTKAQRELGWSPLSFKEGLKETIPFLIPDLSR